MLELLEFPAALDRVAAHAAGPLGAARVRDRRPQADPAVIRAALAQVAELAALLITDDAIRAEPVPDIAATLELLSVAGSALDGLALAELTGALAAARVTAAELKRLTAIAPRTAALRAEPAPKEIEPTLRQAIGPDGAVLDGASRDLARARQRVRDARQLLIQRLERILGGLDQTERAADAAVTLRGGRYVIPVRSTARSRVGGIVHDESATRATVFLEPPEVIELGNDLRAAEAAEAREVLRVLRELTDLIRPHEAAIAAAQEMCVAFDDLCARARYAVEVNGFVPEIGGMLKIRGGRHPLLVSAPGPLSSSSSPPGLLFGPSSPPGPLSLRERGNDGEVSFPLSGTERGSGGEAGARGQVVPFDLELYPDEFTVLISGPNTGGKTVLIKAVGLLCLLAQSGIVPPIGPHSSLPVFTAVFADIGDRQSIAASLSTFSAHVAVLREILDATSPPSPEGRGGQGVRTSAEGRGGQGVRTPAGRGGQGVRTTSERGDQEGRFLVLLDEIGSGTDPAEGGALAAATLKALTRRRAITLATTHLGALKQLAAETVGIVNASLQFDADTLTPTYRLLKGVPGRSYGLAIARRLGVPSDVLAEAERAVPDAERTLDALLAAVEARGRDLDARAAELETRAAQIAAAQRELAELEQREADLAAREKNADKDARERARQYLLEARKTVEAALGQARAAMSDATAREARRMVEEAIEKTAGRLDSGKVGRQKLNVGDRVRTGQGTVGVVVEVRDTGRITVEVGSVRLVIASDLLEVVESRSNSPTVPPSDP